MKKLFRFPTSVYTGILLAFISLTGAGCGVWHDFTTYFNLYYNLSDIYSQAETAVKEQKRNLFDLEEVPISGNAAALFNQVIEKSSKLLQFNHESSFVDNALLMLGKSFYYLQNYQKALRKFDELVMGQPNSDFVLEAEFWAAKTQLRLRNYDDGLKRLKAVKEKAVAADDGNVLTLIYIEEIKYQLGNKNYVVAVDLCKSLVQYDYDSGISAETCFELGKLYLLINQYQDAVQAFRDVNKYSPTYDLAFNASVELGRALREVKENEAALEVFQKLRREAKYSDKYDVVDLEIGISQMNLGNYKQAMSKLRIVDTSFAASMNAGVARFYIGKMLEENYKLYDSASVFYKKAASSTAPPEIQAKAQSKVAVFTKYNTIMEQLNTQNTQMGYLKDSTLYVKDSIKYVEDTAKIASEMRQKMAESSNKRVIRGEGDRGGDNQQNMPVAQNSPGVSNLKAPVYPKMTQDSLKGLIVKTKYDLGSIYFAELNQVDSAMYFYNEILSECSDTMKPKTLFALGNCYQTLNMKEKADSIYNYIYENYKTNPVVNSAALRINKPQIDLNFDPAKSLFIEAEKLMLKKEYAASLKGFYDIFLKHPKSAFAPKALLASGWVLENNLKMYDSAAVMYDSVISKYPQSQYASSVKGKMDVYKLEASKKKSKLGVRDSLSIAADSIKALKKDVAVAADSTAKLDIAAKSDNAVEMSAEEEVKNQPAKKAEDDKPKNIAAKDGKKPKGKVTLNDLSELERIKEQIAEAEKQVMTLKAQRDEIIEKTPGDPKIKEALKQLLETKANLEKLPK